MGRAWLVGLILLAGCDGPAAAGRAGSALSAGRWRAAPAWTADARVADRRGEWTLVRGAAAAGPPGTDVRPAAPHAVLRDDGSALLPPTDVLGGRLLAGAVAWVGADGTLWIDDGARPRPVHDDVIAELDVGPDGHLLAYARRPGRGAGVWSIRPDDDAPRHLTPGLAVADRPRFVDDRHLVVVGARPGGIAGVWVVRHGARSPQPVPVTNAGLSAGEPLGPAFVPPPAFHASMEVRGDTLLYDDGETRRHVSLREALR